MVSSDSRFYKFVPNSLLSVDISIHSSSAPGRSKFEKNRASCTSSTIWSSGPEPARAASLRLNTSSGTFMYTSTGFTPSGATARRSRSRLARLHIVASTTTLWPSRNRPQAASTSSSNTLSNTGFCRSNGSVANASPCLSHIIRSSDR